MVAGGTIAEPFACRAPAASEVSGAPFELMLFLPREQAVALEAAAHARGLTVGQLVRRLVQDFTDPARELSGRDDGWEDPSLYWS